RDVALERPRFQVPLRCRVDQREPFRGGRRRAERRLLLIDRLRGEAWTWTGLSPVVREDVPPPAQQLLDRLDQHALRAAPRPNGPQLSFPNPVVDRAPRHTEDLRRPIDEDRPQHAAPNRTIGTAAFAHLSQLRCTLL